jgi:hypothetical protein
MPSTNSNFDILNSSSALLSLNGWSSNISIVVPISSSMATAYTAQERVLKEYLLHATTAALVFVSLVIKIQINSGEKLIICIESPNIEGTRGMLYFYCGNNSYNLCN